MWSFPGITNYFYLLVLLFVLPSFWLFPHSVYFYHLLPVTIQHQSSLSFSYDIKVHQSFIFSSFTLTCSSSYSMVTVRDTMSKKPRSIRSHVVRKAMRSCLCIICWSEGSFKMITLSRTCLAVSLWNCCAMCLQQ